MAQSDKGVTGLANTKSARKMMRVIERRRQRNRPIRSAAKTYIAKAKALISDDELEAGKTAAAQALDKAVRHAYGRFGSRQ